MYAGAKLLLPGTPVEPIGFLLYIACGVLATLPLRSIYHVVRRSGPGLPAQLALAVPVSLVAALVWLLVFDAVVLRIPLSGAGAWETYARGFLNKAPVLVAWSALYLGIKQWQDLQHERERTLQAVADARQAQLLMLRYQLQPHFLFNTLNSLRALITEDAARARDMVSELADFLRASLAAPGAAVVPLRDELATVRRYLAIQQIRFEHQLVVRFEVEPAAEAFPVPPLLLHPLVENAVKYGIRTSPRPLRVRIRALAKAGGVTIEVANTGRWGANGTGPDFDPENGTGVGLENVRQRLLHQYSQRHRFVVEEADGWVLARIEISAPTEPVA